MTIHDAITTYTNTIHNLLTHTLLRYCQNGFGNNVSVLFCSIHVMVSKYHNTGFMLGKQ